MIGFLPSKSHEEEEIELIDAAFVIPLRGECFIPIAIHKQRTRRELRQMADRAKHLLRTVFPLVLCINPSPTHRNHQPCHLVTLIDERALEIFNWREFCVIINSEEKRATMEHMIERENGIYVATKIELRIIGSSDRHTIPVY